MQHTSDAVSHSRSAALHQPPCEGDADIPSTIRMGTRGEAYSNQGQTCFLHQFIVAQSAVPHLVTHTVLYHPQRFAIFSLFYGSHNLGEQFDCLHSKFIFCVCNVLSLSPVHFRWYTTEILRSWELYFRILYKTLLLCSVFVFFWRPN